MVIQIQFIFIMWDIQGDFSKQLSHTLPNITLINVTALLTALIILRFLLDKVLHFYFQINQTRPQHNINSLQYSYFYHLSILILILAQVDWNMFDLSVWVGSYVGVGLIRKAIHTIRIQRELILSDCSYNKKIMQILSASKLFGLLLFLGSIAYYLVIQSLFFGTTVKLSSLLLFPTLMLTIDSAFLLFSSHLSQRDILIYYNQNINQLPPNYKVALLQKILGNSVRMWHYINVLKLFFKSLLQRLGLIDCVWILSVLNAFYLSSADLYSSVKRYRAYNRLIESFNKIFRPSQTAPDQNCVICMCQLLNCRKLSTCGHLFHYKCLFEWIQNKNDCPICRNPIDLAQQ